jgi:hypothetical protein
MTIKKIEAAAAQINKELMEKRILSQSLRLKRRIFASLHHPEMEQ